jgi:4-oxalomesaconate hydratase
MAAKSMLVVAAHSGDFVWRAGGAIALHAKNGFRMGIVCLSSGARGESNALWTDAAATLPSVRARRREEALAAAEVLGAEIMFFDHDDYPLVGTSDLSQRLADIYRQWRPEAILTHAKEDPANLDHARTHTLALEARMIAIAPGHGRNFIFSPQFYAFEPHQSELCSFVPNVLLDITQVWEIKKRAMECLPTQKNLWDYYARLALQRGAHAGRRSGSVVSYAEAFQRLFPQVADSLC